MIDCFAISDDHCTCACGDRLAMMRRLAQDPRIETQVKGEPPLLSSRVLEIIGSAVVVGVVEGSVSTGRRSSRAPRHRKHAPVSSSQATTHLSLPLSLLRDGRKYDLPSSYVVSTWPLVLSLILTHGLVVLRPGHTAAVLDPAR